MEYEKEVYLDYTIPRTTGELQRVIIVKLPP